MFSDILAPFFIGGLLAYIFHPLVSKIESKLKISRGIFSAILILSIFIILVIALIFLIPYIQSQLLGILHSVPEYVGIIQGKLTKIAAQFSNVLSQQDIVYMKDGIAKLINSVLNWGVGIFSSLLSKGVFVANILSVIVLTPVVAIFFLKDWPTIIQKFDDLFPQKYRKITHELMGKINLTLAQFMRGQMMLASVLMIYYGISLSIISVPGSLVIALIASLFSFIPYFAISFGFIAAFTSGFFAGFSGMENMILFFIFLLGGILEGVILGPILVGQRVGLHPLWTLFSVLVGGKIAGFLGVLVAVPIAAVCGVLIRFALDRYFSSRYYQ